MKFIFTQLLAIGLFVSFLSAQSGKVGIGTTTPAAKLDVNGDLRIGFGDNEAPPAGTIRWNPGTGDFEGFNGNHWVSLTRSNSWGQVTATENSFFDNLGSVNGFGNSIDISGDWAIVGYSRDDLNGDDSGRAYMFKFENGAWNFKQSIFPTDFGPGDRFGASVAISGDFAIIGAPRDDDGGTDAGAAYIFSNFFGTWLERDKLVASNAQADDFFGGAVSISGEYAIVGARGRDDFGSNSGAAYIFKKDQPATAVTFTETDILNATGGDANASDFFGRSVDLSGTRAVIGASGDDQAGPETGAAYIFERTIGENWSQVSKLLPANPQTEERMGYSVSISGSTAVVGAQDDGLGETRCIVYGSIIPNLWFEEAILVPSTNGNYNFGEAISISGNVVVIGANGEYGPEISSGAAYVFERTGSVWSEVAKLKASDAKLGTFFGTAVAVDIGQIIVGATSGGRADNGAAYFFH